MSLVNFHSSLYIPPHHCFKRNITPCPKHISIDTGIQQLLHLNNLNVQQRTSLSGIYTYITSLYSLRPSAENQNDTYCQPPVSSITDSVAAQVPLGLNNTPAKVVPHRNGRMQPDTSPAQPADDHDRCNTSSTPKSGCPR